MAVSAREYTEHLKALLPRGPAWPREDETSMLAFMIEVWAIELSRVDGRVMSLINESDPRFCSETFQQWLDQWGVPDDCMEAWGSILSDGLTEQMLRQALIQKMKTVGSQSLKFFIELARTYGYDITIDEFRPWTVMSTVMNQLVDKNGQWVHWWKVQVHTGKEGQIGWHDAIGTAEEALCWWGDAVIECVIKAHAPAHTRVVFGYYGDSEE